MSDYNYFRSHRPRRARLTAVVAAGAIGASALLGACGSSTSKPSVSAIVARIKSDSTTDLQGITTKELTCLANVIRKYGQTSSLEQWVDGKITSNQVKGSDSTAASNAGKACI